MKLIHADCLDYFKQMDSLSIDSIVCDPPYGIKFRNEAWDETLSSERVWRECYRLLKPGGYILSMSSPRFYHLQAQHIESAGFITHPLLGWIHSQGFPKGTDLSKQFDKQCGAKRKKGKVLRMTTNLKGGRYGEPLTKKGRIAIREEVPVSPLAKKYSGWKYGLQALKPALEPIYMGQKPWKGGECGKMTDNILLWGVGALNINGCRIPRGPGESEEQGKGRYPGNLIHDAEESLGAVARFFYCAKASQKEKNQGLKGRRNHHPTVKPVALFSHLIKLVTPPQGVILDPFMGSGTSALAALQLNMGFDYIGIEKERTYFELASQRVKSFEEVL